MHRWIMSGAVILGRAAIFFVMVPSLYFYYIMPDINLFDGFSILQITHSIVGIPTIGISYNVHG